MQYGNIDTERFGVWEDFRHKCYWVVGFWDWILCLVRQVVCWLSNFQLFGDSIVCFIFRILFNTVLDVEFLSKKNHFNMKRVFKWG